MRLIAALAVSIAVVAAAGGSAHAARYAVSKSPYWAVGKYDGRLSSACQRHAFNQVRDLRIDIGFDGKQGTAVVGVAAKGFNLYDPGGLAQPDVHYHFFNDGYSNCRVYWAPVK